MSKTLKISDTLGLPLAVASQAVCLVGIRGSGKTNTAGVIAEELLDQHQQIVVLDPTDAWWGLRSKYPVFIFGGPHGDLPLAETDGKTLAEFVVQEQVPIILSLRHLRKGAQRRLVTEFCEELYHLKGQPDYRTPLTVFIDEAPQFIPQRVMGEMARLVGAVQDMILLGRSAGFGVVMISQRFATLNADVRTQADTVIVHRMPSPLDRKALTDWIEENATIAEQKEVLSSLAKLKTGEAWIWAPYFEIFKQLQVRARRTFDSSAAPSRGVATKAPKDLAAVDLAKLKAKLHDAVEKAKADDPKELRKRIAELSAELKKAQQVTPSSTPAKTLTAEPALTEADRALLLRIAEGQDAILSKLMRPLDVSTVKAAVEDGLRTFLDDEDMSKARLMDEVVDLFKGKRFEDIREKVNALSPPLPPIPSGRVSIFPARTSPPVHREAGSVHKQAGDAAVRGGAFRSMLVALAQAGRPLADNQVAARAGMALSGTFDKYLGQQRTNGWVDGPRSALVITPTGLSALGAYDPLPTGPDLQRYWLDYVGNGAKRAMLATLIEAYPKTLRDDQVAERVPMALSGTFDKYLGRLRTLQLVTGSRQALQASAELFA